jgi:hypothetical protein
LNASNRDSDDDEKDDVMANAVDDDQFDHCSSAYAFLRLAMGALMEQKTPIKSGIGCQSALAHRRVGHGASFDAAIVSLASQESFKRIEAII